MRRSIGLGTVAAMALVGLVTAACASDESSSSPGGQSASASKGPSASGAPVAPLVGRWKQVHHCQALVDALNEEGLAAIAPSCDGKHPQLHFHFFTESGQFGSLDKNEDQVDDGKYEIIDAHTFRIGDSTFNYRALDGGDTLMLAPVITRAQRREALARGPMEFSDAMWMVAVAYPGTTWTRVPCEGWC